MDEETAFVELQRIFQNKILPLLEEYFFEDWEKIRLVLADNQKLDEAIQFITVRNENIGVEALFGASEVLGYDMDEMKTFDRNSEALSHPEAYISIYAP